MKTLPVNIIRVLVAKVVFATIVVACIELASKVTDVKINQD